MTDISSNTPIVGRCHCSNIGFTFEWPSARSEIPVRVCSCDFCRKHGGRWTSNPSGRFSLSVKEPNMVECYRFGTKTADFHVCKRCGVVPIVTCVLDARRYAVVNANAFEGIDWSRLVEKPISFEEEAISVRLDRRRVTWTLES